MKNPRALFTILSLIFVGSAQAQVRQNPAAGDADTRREIRINPQGSGIRPGIKPRAGGSDNDIGNGGNEQSISAAQLQQARRDKLDSAVKLWQALLRSVDIHKVETSEYSIEAKELFKRHWNANPSKNAWIQILPDSSKIKDIPGPLYHPSSVDPVDAIAYIQSQAIDYDQNRLDEQNLMTVALVLGHESGHLLGYDMRFEDVLNEIPNLVMSSAGEVKEAPVTIQPLTAESGSSFIAELRNNPSYAWLFPGKYPHEWMQESEQRFKDTKHHRDNLMRTFMNRIRSSYASYADANGILAITVPGGRRMRYYTVWGFNAAWNNHTGPAEAYENAVRKAFGPFSGMQVLSSDTIVSSFGYVQNIGGREAEATGSSDRLYTHIIFVAPDPNAEASYQIWKIRQFEKIEQLIADIRGRLLGRIISDEMELRALEQMFGDMNDEELKAAVQEQQEFSILNLAIGRVDTETEIQQFLHSLPQEIEERKQLIRQKLKELEGLIATADLSKAKDRLAFQKWLAALREGL